MSYAMKLHRRVSVLKSAVLSTLAGVLLFLFLDVTEAQSNPTSVLSLSPSPAVACETLVIGWHLMAAPSYSIQIVANRNQATLFQTTVPTPTSSVEWLVLATDGASLHLAIFALMDLNPMPHLATDFLVQSSLTNCAAHASPAPTTPNIPPVPTSTSTFLPTPTNSVRTPSTIAPPSSQSSTATTTPTSTEVARPTVASPRTASISTSQPQTVTSEDPTKSGPPLSAVTSGSAPGDPSLTFPPGASPFPSSTFTNNVSNRAPSSRSIAGAVVGSLAGIALIVLALYLLRRRRTQAVREATPSPTPTSYTGIRWLPRRTFLNMDSNGDRSRLGIYEELHTPVDGTAGSFMPQASPVQSNPVDDGRHIPQLNRECVEGPAAAESERVFRELRARKVASEGARRQADTEDSDLRSTVTSDWSESTLPPPYQCSLYYGET